MSLFHQLGDSVHPCDVDVQIMLVGPSGAGKSSILSKFLDGRFSRHLAPTTGFEVGCKIIDCGGMKCKLNIIDTSGQGIFEELYHDYYIQCNGVFLVFDTSDKASFLTLSSWARNLSSVLSKQCVVFLVGNKSDDVVDVSSEEILEFCDEHQLISEYVEVSAMHGRNIGRMFHNMIAHIIDRCIQFSRSMSETSVKRGGRPRKPRFSQVDKSKFEEHWNTVPWVENSEQRNCYICGKAFNWWKRYHHCRVCGNCVCYKCSPIKKQLPEYGYDKKKQRVCNYCVNTKDILS
jgi:small GTP-binding protein